MEVKQECNREGCLQKASLQRRFLATRKKEADAERITWAKTLIILFISLAIEDFIKTRILILLSHGEKIIPLMPCGGESRGVGYNGVRAIESEASFFSSLFPFSVPPTFYQFCLSWYSIEFYHHLGKRKQVLPSQECHTGLLRVITWTWKIGNSQLFDFIKKKHHL